MLATLAAAPLSAQSWRQDYPSCDLDAAADAQGADRRHDPRSAPGPYRDARQYPPGGYQHRRKARRLSQAEAQTLWNTVARIHRDANRFVAKQGFLSAGETASYDRALDGVAMRVVRVMVSVRHLPSPIPPACGRGVLWSKP